MAVIVNATDLHVGHFKYVLQEVETFVNFSDSLPPLNAGSAIFCDILLLDRAIDSHSVSSLPIQLLESLPVPQVLLLESFLVLHGSFQCFLFSLFQLLKFFHGHF